MLTLMHGLEYSWVLGSASLGTVTKFPFGSVVEVRFLEGALSLEGSSRKALRPGGEDSEVPFPHSTRSPQLGSEWSWLGNPVKTFRYPSEGLPWFDHLQDHQKDLHLDKVKLWVWILHHRHKRIMNELFVFAFRDFGQFSEINNFSRTAFIDWSDTLLVEKKPRIFSVVAKQQQQ